MTRVTLSLVARIFSKETSTENLFVETGMGLRLYILTKRLSNILTGIRVYQTIIGGVTFPPMFIFYCIYITIYLGSVWVD